VRGFSLSPAAHSSGLSATFSPDSGEKGRVQALKHSPHCFYNMSFQQTWRCPIERRRFQAKLRCLLCDSNSSHPPQRREVGGVSQQTRNNKPSSPARGRGRPQAAAGGWKGLWFSMQAGFDSHLQIRDTQPREIPGKLLALSLRTGTIRQAGLVTGPDRISHRHPVHAIVRRPILCT
jgi:hypothetical protein